MVAPRVHASQRRRRKSAQAIRLQPFASESGVEMAANAVIETNHGIEMLKRVGVPEGLTEAGRWGAGQQSSEQAS